MAGLAVDLAHWARDLVPAPGDHALADAALLDTVAVTVAARDEPIGAVVAGMPETLRWGALGHVLDFDDLHLPSTAHISVVCVAAALATGGDARAYLAGAGVMARLGDALGWSHYSQGWHATCTTGAPAAAVTAAAALGLDAPTTARALALAVPAAGGVQRAFGTQAKPLQVGFAVDAGVRAAHLAAAGASADVGALDQWMSLVGGPQRVEQVASALGEDAVPGGLAIKLHPCCYALQRPISAVLETGARAADVTGIRLRTPAAAVQPLLDRLPVTGLEGKFSLEYAVAAALLDGPPTFGSFGDAAVARPEAARLMDCVRTELTPGGDGLLAGDCALELDLRDGTTVTAVVDVPPGAPGRPPGAADLEAKVRLCAGRFAGDLLSATWAKAPALLREMLADSSLAT